MTPRYPSNPTAFPERIAFLGGYEPRRCGIATFTRDLCEAVAAVAPDLECFAGAVNDRVAGYKYPDRVRFEILEKDHDSYRRAADFLNFGNTGVLSLQHEFGIYGGMSGRYILTLLKELRMPVVTTLHTVLGNPDPSQRVVMEELARRSDRLVVMAKKGAEILRETFGIPADKIDVIPHGIPDLPFSEPDSFKAALGIEGRMVLLTFGLLGPGKGIEHVIEALPEVIKRHPKVVYLILGATHPHLIASEGENYRLGLERLVEARGVADHVIFYNRFVTIEDLTKFIRAADIYVTPYLNEAQITSGTLAYAFGAGKGVVSTPYWHARELLADDRGVLVPFRDPQAMAAGIGALLDDPDRLQRTRAAAYEAGRQMIWPAVGKLYLDSFERAQADRRAAARTTFAGWTLASRPYELPPLRLDHIARMSDGTGIFQHAIFTLPNFHEGYCTDDNARAFILATLLDELGSEPNSHDIRHLSVGYLAFLAAALNHETGRFRNFMSHGREWLEEIGSEDSHGRAMWALGFGANRSHNEGYRKLCTRLFQLGSPAVSSFTSPRAWAFTLLGLNDFLNRYPDDGGAARLRHDLTALLVNLWKTCADEKWPWFEESATYDNARLSQALILSGAAMGDGEALELGLKSLRWLASVQTTQAGHLRPIGSNGFYVRDGARADFDQQPVEAQAMVSACLAAFRITGDPDWSREAKRAFEWFLGRNDLGLPLYDSRSGGCSDGLHRDRISENQGAESTLAFHLALAEMNCAEHSLTAQPS